MWGTVLKRDLLEEAREEDRFHSKEQVREYIKSEIEKCEKYVVIKNLDVSLVEDLSHLFETIGEGVRSLDLSGWKTSNAKDMNHMFNSLYNLKEVNLSGWDTSNVKDICFMFRYCTSLKSLDVSGWDTSNVKYMSNMVCLCYKLKSLDLSGWDTSKVKDMSNMFTNCSRLESLDLSGWDTSSIKCIDYMFDNCPAPYKVVDNKIVEKYI